jgi:hypothetical protein
MNGLKSVGILAANKPHGTRLKYMGGCKCMLCRAANSRYETERSLARSNGDWNGIVSAAAARRHIRRLSTLGVGYKTVADAASVARSIVMKIRSGERERIRQRTERSILGVNRKAYAGGALIDADPTWRKINKLLEEGFTKAELACRFGLKTRALQFKHFEVTAKTAARVDRFYRITMAGAYDYGLPGEAKP